MNILPCSADGCTSDAWIKKRALCKRHYRLWYAAVGREQIALEPRKGPSYVPRVVLPSPCPECGAIIQRGTQAQKVRKYCSPECSSAVNARNLRKSWERRKDGVLAAKRAANAAKPLHRPTCTYCNKVFESKHANPRFCSTSCATRFRRTNHNGSCSTADCHRTSEARGMCIACWRQWARATGREENPAWDERRKSNYQKRRALKLELPADDIRPIDVYERDGWVCGLCDLPVDRALAYPDDQSPSLDHILPLSKGGHHTLENVQLAHLRCNIRKGARVEDLVGAMPA